MSAVTVMRVLLFVVAFVYAERSWRCEGDCNAGVNAGHEYVGGTRAPIYYMYYMCIGSLGGTRRSGSVSIAADMLGMSVDEELVECVKCVCAWLWAV